MSVPKSLTVGCPACGAAVGEKCRNYRGVNCAPHRQRSRACEARAYAVRWRAPRLRMMEENAGRQRSLFDQLPEPDLS